MRSSCLLLMAFLLGACGGGLRPPEPARFDLGDAAVVWKPGAMPLRGVAVVAPSWLAGSTLAYRLLYADPQRRHAYGESRWAAPPAELIERALNRQVGPAPAGGCRLRLDLDELAQVFDSPQASRALLDARASLVAPNRDGVLAQRAFSLAQPAPSADARGGVAATAAAVRALGAELNAWLESLASHAPEIARHCRAG